MTINFKLHLLVGIPIGKLAEYLLCMKGDKALASCDDYYSLNEDVIPQ
jgi:hypothetical protein